VASFEYSEFFSYRLYDPNATFRKDETKDSMIERILEFKDMINDTMHSMDKREKSVYLSEIEFSGLKAAKTSKTRFKKCFY